MTRRIAYIDVIKALAIFYIVQSHVVYFGFSQEIKSYIMNWPPPALGLFFFVAGLMAGRTRDNEKSILNQLWSRFSRLIVPAVSICLLCAAIWHEHPRTTFSCAYVQQWFCFVLFLISAVFIILKPLYHRVGYIWRIILLACAYLAITAFFNRYSQYKFLVFWNAINIYPTIFFFGILLADKREKFEEFCSRQSIYTLCLILLGIFLSYFLIIEKPENVDEQATIRLTILICLLTIPPAITISKHMAVSLPQSVFKVVTYVGRRSLVIYLLHYLFIFPLTAITPYILSTTTSPVALAVVCVPCTIILIAISLAIDYLLSFVPLLSKLLVGGATDPQPLNANKKILS